MKIPSEKDLLKAGVHFGHKPASWHPKMADFIFGQKNGIHIIDLEQTKKQLETATNFIKKTVADGKTILFVGTKIQAKDIVKKYAESCSMPYINDKWLGGTLTNFKVINSLVKKLEKLEHEAEDKETYAKKYTKREISEFKTEMKRLNKMVGGIREMKTLPGAIFIISARDEKTTILESTRKNIPTIAICDTNANPQKIDYPISGNDDALKSLDLITSVIADAVKEGQKERV